MRNKIDLSIIALQETWLRSYKNVKITEHFEEYRWIFKNADSQLHPEDQITMRNLSFHGAALAVRKKFAENMTEVRVEFKNIAAAEIKIGGKRLLTISAYLPTAGYDGPFEESVDAIAAVLEEYSKDSDIILLLGDMNVDVKSSIRRKTKWMNLLADFDLTDNSTGKPTHRHHVTGATAELDRVVTRGFIPKIEILEEPLNKSDHSPITATFSIKVPKKKLAKKGEPIETKINMEKLDENITVFQELTKYVADLMRETRHDLTLDSQAGLVSSLIFHAAIESTGQKFYQSQEKKKPKRTKIDKSLYREMRIAAREHKRSGNRSMKTPTGMRLKKARKAIRDEIQSQKDQQDLALHRKIIRASREKSSKIFRLLKNIRQAESVENQLPSRIEGYGQIFESPNVLEGLRELFKIQTTIDYNTRFDEKAFSLAEDVIQLRRQTPWSEEEYHAIEISLPQYKEIISKLPAGKAQDYCGLSNDLMKRLHPDLAALLHEITAQCLEEKDYGGIVRNYGKGTIIIKKPGKPVTNIKNWRKIVVNPTFNNILQVYVQPKIEEKVQKIQTPYQLGFTEGIPVINAVIARQELQMISKAMKKTLFFGVLDLQSCFPRISREQMLMLCTQILTPAEWDLMSEIYHNTWGELRIEGQRSEPSLSNIGSIEGGILSVQILKIFIAVLLTMLERAGYNAGVDFELLTMKPGGICVADDLKLFSWNPDVMRLMLSICQYWSDRFRATFSPDKSVVVIQRAPKDKKDHGDFHLNGQKLQVVTVAEHLGVPIVDNGDNSEALVSMRIEKTRRAINAGLALFNPRSFVNIATKLEIWRKQYKSMALYATDTTGLKASQIRKMESFQTKILRSILGLSSRASAVKIRLITGLPTMWFEIWKARFGVLNNIMLGNTITRRYCVLAWHCQIRKSWTFETVSKLHQILVDEDLDEKIRALDLIMFRRMDFKEDVKNIMTGAEIRKLSRELNSENTIFKVPQQPLKTSMPMLSSDFSTYGQRLVKSFSQTVVGDFFRNFGKRCFLCLDKAVETSSEALYEDNTEHFLSDYCDVRNSPLAQTTWAEIKLRISSLNSSNIILSDVVSQRYRARFIINPTCLSLGQNRLTAEEIQSKGIDILIRKLCHFKLKYRYKLLKDRGFITKKKFQFNI